MTSTRTLGTIAALATSATLGAVLLGSTTGATADAGSSCRTTGDRVCRTVNVSTGRHYLTIHAAGEPVATIRDHQGADVVRLGAVDGHRDCFGLVGETTVVTCADAYVTTS